MEIQAVKDDIGPMSTEDLAKVMGITEKQLQKEIKAGERAKDKMVTANLRLVVSVAKIHKEYGTPGHHSGRNDWSVVSKSLTQVVAISLVLTLIGGSDKGSLARSLKSRGDPPTDPCY